jgi:hypothetical protein
VIERLLHAVAGRVTAADAVTKTDATVTVSLDDEGRVTVTESRSRRQFSSASCSRRSSSGRFSSTSVRSCRTYGSRRGEIRRLPSS